MKKLTIFAFVSLLITILASSAFGQTTIKMQDFDETNTLTYSVSGGTTYTGTSTSSDRPASSDFFVSSSTAYGLSNGNATLTFANVTGLDSYITKYYEFRLASWSTSTSGNGADAGDIVTVAISVDGGTTWSNEIRVLGNSNAWWHYTTGTGIASVTYDGNNTPADNAPSGGGGRTTDGYSTVRVNLPDAGTQAQMRITLLNNANNERWTIDDVKIVGTIATQPLLGLTATSFAGFSYFSGAGPSTSQSYNLSGSNLSPAAGDITVTGSTNYEVSTNNSTFAGSVLVSYSGGTLAATPIYVRLKSGLAVGSYNGEDVVNSGGGATSVNVTCNGNVYKNNPTNHATSFTAAAGTPTHSAINLTWLDASTDVLPDYYLIKGSSVSYAAITDPVDGVAESDGALIKNIAQGMEAVSITGLNPNTQYFFKIFPYTNSGTNIRYKTDGVVPQTDRTTAEAPPGVLLLEENFDYADGSQMVNNTWLQTGSTTTNPLLVTSSGLSYDEYPSSSIGRAVTLSAAGGQDIHKDLTPQIADGSTIYCSFLANIASATSTGEYFFHLGNKNGNSSFTSFVARVWVKSDGSNILFGITNGNTGSYGSTQYSLGTTYLFIIKYTINTSGNDEVKLWVLASGVPASEIAAGSPEKSETTTGQDRIDAVSLRQGNSSSAPDITIDGIRIGTAWSESPLPVELSSFTSSVSGQAVNLTWSTATEIDNYGFEVQKSENQSDWSTIGFVHGSGNSNSNKQYAYTDQQAGTGTIYYRLKQIDNAGTFKVYDPIAVEVEIPKDFTLSQNYPNPFNPATTINYTLPTAGSVTLQVYSMNGELVQTLVQGYQAAGSYSVAFDASRLASGTYAYRLITTGADGQTQSALKKMLLMK